MVVYVGVWAGVGVGGVCVGGAGDVCIFVGGICFGDVCVGVGCRCVDVDGVSVVILCWCFRL